MTLTKEQINKVVTILITALIAILGTILGVSVGDESEATPAPMPTVAATATDEVIDMDAFTSFAIRERITFDARDDAYFYNGADLYFYSDDHATQKLFFDGATGDVDVAGSLDVTGVLTVSSLVSQSVGFNASGASTFVSTTVSGPLTVTGDSVLASATVGGGFGSTGCTLSAAGVLQCDGAATIGGAATITGATTLVSTLSVGGGFGSTGCTISAAGALQCDGASTFQGAMTVNNVGDFDSLATLRIDSDKFWDSTGDMQIADNANVTGTLTVAGSATFNALAIVASDPFTPTAGQTLTPTASMYVVNSSAAVSMTLAVCGTDGKLLYLYGDDANTVTVNDTNIRSTDGNAVTFGQYDVVAWICRGNDWIHVSKSANQ